MPLVHFTLPDGSMRSVEAREGDNLMQVAVEHMLPGIVAECGGSLSCATCHAYVTAQSAQQLPPPTQDELDMLEAAANVQPSSRLTCQIQVTGALEGLEVTIPGD